MPEQIETIAITKQRPGPSNWLERFAGYYLLDDLRYPVPDFHREIYRTIADDPTNRIVIAAPRSFAKSVICSKVYPLASICYGKFKRILIISATGTLAEHWLREIKQELENNKFILEDFGDLRSDKWTQDHIITNTGIEVMAKGRGYQIRGFRPDLVIEDDIEDDEEVRSEEQRSKVMEWHDKALINTLESDSRLVMIGTILHPQSLLSNVMTREGWTVMKYKAITPDGKSIWPEKWPIEALERRRREIGSIAFASEFMNEPIITENPIFVKEWVQYYEKASAVFGKVKSGLYVVTAIDPAISKKEEADYTAIVTIGATFDKKPNLYILDARRGHWSMQEQVDELLRVFNQYHQSATIIETVAYQQALFDEIVRLRDRTRIDIRPFEIKPDKDKQRRANTVTPLFQEGRIFFEKDDKGQQHLIDEMMVFPTGDRDDLVDAMVYALGELKEWQGREGGTVTVQGTGAKDPFTGW